MPVLFQSLMFRAAVGFLAGGLLFTRIPRWSASSPAALWISVCLASAAFGLVAACALATPDRTRGRLAAWSAAGWLLGGLLSCLAFQAVAGGGAPPSGAAVVLPALFLGLCGGLGLGLGWGGTRTAVRLGVASAVLLPGSLWFDDLVVRHAGPWLADITALPAVWGEAGAAMLGLAGFAVHGALIGLVLALDEGGGGEVVTAGPWVRYRRTPYEDRTVRRVPHRDAAGRRRAADAAAVSELETMFVDAQAAGDSDGQLPEDCIALGPLDEREADAGAPPAGPPPAARPVEPPEDLGRDGTFRAARRNYHPDYPPGNARAPRPEGPPSPALRILRNYHPAFGPAGGGSAAAAEDRGQADEVDLADEDELGFLEAD